MDNMDKKYQKMSPTSKRFRIHTSAVHAKPLRLLYYLAQIGGQVEPFVTHVFRNTVYSHTVRAGCYTTVQLYCCPYCPMDFYLNIWADKRSTCAAQKLFELFSRAPVQGALQKALTPSWRVVINSTTPQRRTVLAGALRRMLARESSCTNMEANLLHFVWFEKTNKL